MELYFIRHGQSEANAARVYSGWAPYNLTELGEEQARQTRELVKNIPFDRIIVSDILRTQQTARIVFPDRTFELSSDIRELNVDKIVGQPVDEVKARLKSISSEALRDYDYGLLGCESNKKFMARIGHFLNSMDKTSGERVAVVTHFGVIRAVAAYVMGVPLEKVAVRVDNCSVSVLESAPDHWIVKRWNYTREL